MEENKNLFQKAIDYLKKDREYSKNARGVVTQRTLVVRGICAGYLLYLAFSLFKGRNDPTTGMPTWVVYLVTIFFAAVAIALGIDTIKRYLKKDFDMLDAEGNPIPRDVVQKITEEMEAEEQGLAAADDEESVVEASGENADESEETDSDDTK